ncbi:Cmx/CmrA family chloramphenicol efflux MFS transporter [Ruania halotolerans]|uniref:Cmx/CmrA family chloramphenicol efflux MFS transporter n=1 Tax=Ruania halotolerans TaxID=2897773 RepID=UPI001E50E40F|nr:Cmx/CmrA family chloramphenicol efflux MFS transporter [Ruania halotolerans]UFU06121.1 MFS transporter [Ruania halotolerans]
MPRPLYLLALAIFAMGTSEFMLAGLIQDIATDLNVPVGATGLLTSAFAVGMVVGAPVTAALARRWPSRGALLGFLLFFAAVHVLGALTPSFRVLLATRVLAALANAGFLAVALRTATTLVPPERTGRAVAVLLSGVTVATVAGVPGGALLGAMLGWRATFWAIAMLCLPAVAGIVLGLRRDDGAPSAGGRVSLRVEIAQLHRPALMKVMVLGAVVNAATFATFTFLAPIVTDVAGLAGPWVSVALMCFGVGSFVGVTAAGRFSDLRSSALIGLGTPLLLIGWVAMATMADAPVALLTLALVQGMLSFAVGSTFITRVLHEAAGAPTMGGSYATAALNLGAGTGPALAAVVLGIGGGALGPIWVSAALVALVGASLLLGRSAWYRNR